jgi:hypothetical protein
LCPQKRIEMNERSVESREAFVFARYLIGKKTDQEICARYAEAIRIHALQCEGREKKLEKFILRYPFFTGFVDAALALTNKKSVIRKKILVMFALLETVPEYADLFLARKYSGIHLFRIVFIGIRSIYRFLIGFVLIKLFIW